MRNLEVFEVKRRLLKKNTQKISSVAFDSTRTYILDESNLTIFQNSNNELLKQFPVTYRDVTGLQHLDIDQRLWFGTGKELIFLNLADDTLQSIETPYTFEAASFNPTQDSIAIVASNGDVGVFSIDFEVGVLNPLQNYDLGLELPEKFVSVGWGSSATQFKGKSTRTSTQTETEETFDIDGKPEITWRGNGEMFAVSFYQNKRRFKVFQYPYEFLYENEEIVGLQRPIAWRPVGNRIAAHLQTSKRNQIAFFEKNGFFKESFDLVCKDWDVEQLKWSPCGEVLAVLHSNNGQKILDLYTTKNYVWYLKQRLNFKPDNPLVAFDLIASSNPIVTLIASTQNEIISYFFKPVLHYSYEASLVGVINGNNLLITKTEGTIPPPMCDRKITLDTPINFMTFDPTGRKFIIIDSDESLRLFEDEKEIKRIPLKAEQKIPLSHHHFLWKSPDELRWVTEGLEGALLMVMNPLTSFIEDRGTIENVNHWDSLITQRGFDILGQNQCVIAKLPLPPLYVSSVEIDGEIYVFSLTPTNIFYINERELFEGVISFIVHEKYLFLTTNKNVLLGLRLRKSFLDGKDLKPYSRPVEQGSCLLFGVPRTSGVAMQTPRGNLETCTCRIVSIDRLEELLAAQKWPEALDLARIEKLSFSTLIDLNFNRFHEGIPDFIQKVENPAVISDFFLGLQKDDVFKTVYVNCGLAASEEVKGKLPRICDAFIKHLGINYGYYIKCIVIACFVKDSDESVREALMHVRRLLQPSTIELAEEALKSVGTLKPNGEIYNTSLLIYDFDLALFVARHLGLDPKEYEPFIYRLKSLDVLRARFELNHYLKRPKVALKYLIRSSKDLDEITSYVVEYNLYKEAYEEVQPQGDLFISITQLYADFLRAQNAHEEAGVVLSRAHLDAEALEAYKSGLAWSEAVHLLNCLNLDPSERHQHLRDLIDGLLGADRFLEAAELYEHHLNDYENAIVLLLKGRHFNEALRVALKHRRTDIRDSDILESLFDYCTNLTAKLEAMENDFLKYKNRLETLRTQKRDRIKEMHLEEVYGQNRAPNFEDDVLSLAGSNISSRTSGSRSSTLSSRNRRKEERKKQDLREGGFYEDIALMKVLYDLTEEAFALGPQIREVALLSLKINSRILKVSKVLHSRLESLQQLMRDGAKSIWPPDLNNPSNPEATYLYGNVNSLGVKYREAPLTNVKSWKIDLLSL